MCNIFNCITFNLNVTLERSKHVVEKRCFYIQKKIASRYRTVDESYLV